MGVAVDYSSARPDPANLKASGYAGAIRYIGYDPRCITLDEQRRLHDAGVATGYVYEGAADRVLSGFSGGSHDAAFSNDFLDHLDVPLWLPIFGVAVDFDASDQQLRGGIADYFRGWLSASKRPVRPYGDFRTLETLCGELRLAACGWQCVGWSGGRISQYACMFQSSGGPVPGTDHNAILMPIDFLWHPSMPLANGEPTTPQESDDVISDTQMETIKGWINTAAEQWGAKFKAEIQTGDFQAIGGFSADLAGRLDATNAKLDALLEATKKP